MKHRSILRHTMALLVFSVCGTTAHADGKAYLELSVSPEFYSKNNSVESVGGLGIRTASLEAESQMAIDLLTQQLTAAQFITFPQFEGLISGPVGSQRQMYDAFSAETSINQLATLEPESSKAIEDMKRLLQDGD